MNALHWLRRAREGAEGVAEVRAALLDATEAELARPRALALSRVGAVDALGVVLSQGSPAARLAALEALETIGSAAAGRIAFADVAAESETWMRRRRVRLATLAGIGTESAWDLEDPAVSSVLVELGRVSDEDLEAALERAPEGAGRAWSELAWWACTTVSARARAGEADLGLAPSIEALGGHANAFVRAAAASALVALGSPPVFEVPGLWRDDVPGDLGGVRALDDQVEADVERASLALLLTADLDVALAAVGRVAGSRTELARDVLVGGTEHPRPEVRSAAARGLDGRVGGSVWEAYTRWVRDEPDPERRLSVLWTVSRRKEPEAMRALIAWSAAESVLTRRESLRGLAARVRKSRRARTEVVRAALEARAGDPDPQVRSLASGALDAF